MSNTKRSYINRLVEASLFSLAACIFGVRSRYDIIYVSSPPLTIGIPALVLSYVKRIPIVFEIRDCWPEVPIQFGVLRNRFLIRLAKLFEKSIYKRSSHLIPLSEGMAEVISKTGTNTQMTVVPNCCDLDLFNPDISGVKYKKELSLEGKFSAIYFGAMNEANGLDVVIGAAKLLQNDGDNNVYFILHGNGKEKGRLQELSRQSNLQNMVFSDAIRDKESVAELIAACDLCLVIYKNIPILYTCSPNKLFDALSAGKPVVVNTPGWTKKLVEDNQVGFYVEPDNPRALADMLKSLSNNAQMVKEYGENARRLAESDFAREKQAAILLRILQRVNDLNNTK